MALFLIIAQCTSAKGIIMFYFTSVLNADSGFVFVVSVLFYPSARAVEICAGDNFTLTCVTDTGTLVWIVGGIVKTFDVHSSGAPASLGDHIRVYLTSISGSVITSVANITRAPAALHGTVIQCLDQSFGEMEAHSILTEKTMIVSGTSCM